VPLSDTHHQGFAQRVVQRALARDRVPHAFLFHGPEGVGKEMLANGLAQRLLCANPVERKLSPEDAAAVGLEALSEGCGRCEDCRLIAAGTHPDVHLVDRTAHRDHPDPLVRKRSGMELTVDVIRHFVIDKVALTPNRGRAKVFILRGADEMTVQAQNALLKTLEEPPGPTFLVLLASALEYLLATTQSRCQIVRFDALPAAFVRTKLAELSPGLPADQLAWCATWSEGSVGRAKEAAAFGLFGLAKELDEKILYAARLDPSVLVKFWAESAKALGEKYADVDAEITDAEATRRGTITMLRLTAHSYSTMLRDACDAPDQAEALAAGIGRIATAIGQLDLNVNAQLCLEALANDLVSPVAV